MTREERVAKLAGLKKELEKAKQAETDATNNARSLADKVYESGSILETQDHKYYLSSNGDLCIRYKKEYRAICVFTPEQQFELRKVILELIPKI